MPIKRIIRNAGEDVQLRHINSLISTASIRKEERKRRKEENEEERKEIVKRGE
jgi:hypothetical protein